MVEFPGTQDGLVVALSKFGRYQADTMAQPRECLGSLVEKRNRVRTGWMFLPGVLLSLQRGPGGCCFLGAEGTQRGLLQQGSGLHVGSSRFFLLLLLSPLGSTLTQTHPPVLP